MASEQKTNPADRIVPDTDAAQAYVRGIVARGEAAPAGADGKLPPGITHEIVGQHAASGLPILVRRRMY
ncbi:MAG TPA: hypothetical protein VFF16_05845 [Telluria sp.]|nr:hypothetical protein [Telluria sp.]